MKDECCKCNEKIIQETISKLPESQQLAVRACFAAAKLKDKKGIRYSNEWVYECILLRIKSTKTYNHLKSRNILTLPSISTLNRYTKNVKGCYGFQTSTFEILKKKTANMKSNDVRGVLLVDEMKLSKTLYFNRTNLKVEGFVDLGAYTSQDQKQKKGDHALVLMFQPFKGTWVQSLACFLSVGNTSASILHKIIMECIILTEQAGLKIDAVVSDGASWNRSMWNIFGVSEECVSVEHIVDIERRLWFISDFPHLIKCLRNYFSQFDRYTGIYTPDGVVSLKHWYAILALEHPHGFNLKSSYNLDEYHIKPKYYQKMNVAMAFRFFGVAPTMKLLQELNSHYDLNDADGSIKFCTRVYALITAMNSRTPKNSLRPDNPMYKDIENFKFFKTMGEKSQRNEV